MSKRRRVAKIHSTVNYNVGDVQTNMLIDGENPEASDASMHRTTKQLKSISAINREREKMLEQRMESISSTYVHSL